MKLETRLRARRDAGHKLLVPYVTGGLGASWCDVVRAVAGAGADAIEIGIPFSDPIMDGKTIQEASQRALELGATPMSVLVEAATIDVDVPLVVMTYYNLVAHAGHERFARALVESDIDGAIVPDLPLDELDGWGDVAGEHGVETVLLASPTTTDARLDAISRALAGIRLRRLAPRRHGGAQHPQRHRAQDGPEAEGRDRQARTARCGYLDARAGRGGRGRRRRRDRRQRARPAAPPGRRSRRSRSLRPHAPRRPVVMVAIARRNEC